MIPIFTAAMRRPPLLLQPDEIPGNAPPPLAVERRDHRLHHLPTTRDVGLVLQQDILAGWRIGRVRRVSRQDLMPRPERLEWRARAHDELCPLGLRDGELKREGGFVPALGDLAFVYESEPGVRDRVGGPDRGCGIDGRLSGQRRGDARRQRRGHERNTERRYGHPILPGKSARVTDRTRRAPRLTWPPRGSPAAGSAPPA